MCAILTAGAVSSVAFFVHQRGSFVQATRFPGYVLEGKLTADLDSAYEEALPVRGLAAGLYGAASYVLFGEGRPGVLIGADGWLFTTEEFETAPHLEGGVGRSVARIVSVRDRLARLGVDLAVAVVPAKAAVHGEQLGGHRFPDRAWQRYDLVLRGLAAHGIAAPDLRARLIAAKARQPMYLRTDTHWSVAGASQAARAVAAAIARRADMPRSEVTLTAQEPVDHEGDLVKFLALGPFQQALGPEHDRIVPLRARTESADQAADLFGEVPIPVALVGTSYSADPTWSFAAALSAELSADVLNVAADGLGAFRPMEDYLASPELRDRPPAVVVWELPERYLDDGPESEEPARRAAGGTG